MAEKIYNEWTFSGEIVNLKELDGEFSASVKLRGFSRRVGASSAQVAEIVCLAEKDLYAEMQRTNVKVYDKITLSGHLEQWLANSKGKPVNKTMLIADYTIDEEE